MNKRQKKKLFKKKTGFNPFIGMIYSHPLWHYFIGKPWGGQKEWERQWEAGMKRARKAAEIRNLENVTRILAKRRKPHEK